MGSQVHKMACMPTRGGAYRREEAVKGSGSQTIELYYKHFIIYPCESFLESSILMST